MRWLVVLLLGCAHAPEKPKPAPAKVEPTPAPIVDDREPCTVVTSELTLAPLPASELQRIGNGDFITLRREQCFGTCPVYSVTVHADGKITARGERYVAQQGEQSWEIDPTVAVRLLAELMRINVWALDPKMNVHVTDLPTARLEGTIGGHPVSVTHYGAGADLGFGGRDFATANRLETLIDLISEAERRIVGCR